MAWDDRLKDFKNRRERARGMGGPERLAKRASEGRLNARERIDRLCDSGSFLEVGTFNVSDVPGQDEATPADSKVAGFGRKHLIDEVIDPADTRSVIARFLELSRTKRVLGRHRLAGWPTKF